MLTTLNPDQLRAFVTVVECGGFSAAAQRLLRGQSAVSLQIKKLEDRLGVRLLERHSRALALTREGEMLLDDARRLLALNDQLLHRFRDEEVAGLVRFGAPEDFATSHLPAILARFTDAYPKVTLEVTCELTLELFQRFDDGGLDLALVKREPGLTAEGLNVWREPLVWVASAGSRAVDAPSIPLAVSPRPCVYRKRATSSLEDAGRAWRISYTCSSLAGVLAAVRAGLGIAVLPKEMVPPDLVILNHQRCGLPALDDTEIALIQSPSQTPASHRLAETIIHALEHR